MKRFFISTLVVFIASIYSTPQVHAEGDPACELVTPPTIKEVLINVVPSYFSKITPDGKYMCYISSRQNHLIAVDDPNTHIIIPGPYDPVPTPPDASGKYMMTVPYGGMNFYSMEDIKSKIVPGQTTSVDLQPTYRDGSNGDSYQSVGLLQETPKKIYRVLSGSLSIDDYDTTTTPWTVILSKKEICGVKGRYHLPMLSKTGRELAVYDSQEGVTKIFALSETGECTEKLSLGFATGKVEFNYDSSVIAFHVDSYSSSGNGNQFSGAPTNMTKNVYTLQLKHVGTEFHPGLLRKLTSNTERGTAAYYPSFTKDGKVAFVQSGMGPGKNQYGFIVMDPKSANPTRILTTGPNCAPSNEMASIYALGALWGKACKEMATGLGATEKSMWTLSLDPKVCQNMVRKKWNDFQAEIKQSEEITRTGKVKSEDLAGLTIENLLAACPSTPAAATPAPPGPKRQTAATTIAQVPQARRPETPAQIFEAVCKSCHGSGAATTYDWNNLSLNEVNNMLIAMNSGAMPREHIDNRDSTLAPMIAELTARRSALESAAP